MNKQLIFTVFSAIMFTVLVFMYFTGYWTADKKIQIIFFLSMVFSIYSAGIESGKILKNKT